MLKPFLINAADVIYRIENDIEIIFSVKHFGEPANIGEFRAISFRTEIFQDLGILAGRAKYIEIFCVSVNTGMVKNGKSTTKHISGSAFIQQLQRLPVKIKCFFIL